MSGAHPGAHEPVSILYKIPTHFGREIIPALEVIGGTSRRRRNRNLSRLLETLSQSLLTLHWFLPVLVLVARRCCEIGKLKEILEAAEPLVQVQCFSKYFKGVMYFLCKNWYFAW